MEVRGFEPLASSVRGKRSAGLSYTPGSVKTNCASVREVLRAQTPHKRAVWLIRTEKG